MEDCLKIMDLPVNERPRERLIRYGVESLSNAELLAIILRTGTQNKSILNICNMVLKNSNGLNGLLTMNMNDFMKLKGIGKVKASQIVAIVELSKRFRSYKSGDDYKITSPRDAAFLLMEDMRCLKKEHFRIIMLNIKNIVLKIKDISIGNLNSSIVHPREVFSEAIKNDSASIIVCHNHPSGDPTPSIEDINVTKRLKKCGELLGINILDHIIIGNGKYISLKEIGNI